MERAGHPSPWRRTPSVWPAALVHVPAPPWRRLARRPSLFGLEAVRCATFTACTPRPRDDAWLDDSLIVPTHAWIQRALEYAALVPDPPYCGLLPIPPHQDLGLEI
ncbi:hypothetical protein MRX96_051846 [Rhipicephalus microplus]